MKLNCKNFLQRCKVILQPQNHHNIQKKIFEWCFGKKNILSCTRFLTHIKNMKPIVCFDTETTGVDTSNDKIIQIAMVKFNPDNYQTIGTLQHYTIPDGEWSIPPSATEVHHLTKEFILQNGVPFNSVAQEIIAFFEGCDILTYNGNNFDLIILQNNLKSIGIDWTIPDCKLYDSLVIEKKINGMRLVDVYQRYFGEEFEAHDAFADVNATIKVFEQQMTKHKDVVETIDFSMLSPDGFIKRNADGIVVFAKGKYKDKPVHEVCENDKPYINWIWEKDFSPITKENIKKAYYSHKNHS